MQHFVHGGDERERHVRPHLVGNVAEVLLVVRRHHDCSKPRAIRSEHLLLHAADLQNLPAQRHFSGYRGVTPYGTTAQHTGDSEGDCRACARSVLWNCPGGEVDVKIALLEILLCDSEEISARTHVRIRSVDRLTHHAAELPGDRKLSRAGHAQGFDQHQVAAGCRPCESGNRSDLRFLVSRLERGTAPA